MDKEAIVKVLKDLLKQMHVQRASGYGGGGQQIAYNLWA